FFAGPSILKRKKKIVAVSDQELLLMLRAYQTHPCSWDRIIDTVKENIHTLTNDAQDLYKNCTNKQIRTRLSVKLGKLLALPADKIKNIMVKYVFMSTIYNILEELAKVKILETRLTKDHQNVPGPSTANDKRDKILEDLSSEDDNNGPVNSEPKKNPQNATSVQQNIEQEEPKEPEEPKEREDTNEEEIEQPQAAKRAKLQKPKSKKMPLMNLIKKNHEAYSKFITKKVPKLLRSLGVSSSESDDDEL
ncbi:uncharacterized protein LOC127722334, partial [Mytilus californianus]|uniref:uncharacterized protein LOC127722334 n=1 Tax=Mytilus californianus TaxID=6549 RepID=UPI0022480A76